MEKKDLKPAGVFKYFEEICQVPRPSKKEEKMIAYLKAFGAKHNLETKVDEAGNVLIKKPATPGKENLQTVVLQSHIDMVCEKNNDVQHDFLTDPIETEIDGEWLKAKGTTLGAHRVSASFALIAVLYACMRAIRLSISLARLSPLSRNSSVHIFSFKRATRVMS